MTALTTPTCAIRSLVRRHQRTRTKGTDNRPYAPPDTPAPPIVCRARRPRWSNTAGVAPVKTEDDPLDPANLPLKMRARRWRRSATLERDGRVEAAGLDGDVLRSAASTGLAPRSRATTSRWRARRQTADHRRRRRGSGPSSRRRRCGGDRGRGRGRAATASTTSSTTTRRRCASGCPCWRSAAAASRGRVPAWLGKLASGRGRGLDDDPDPRLLQHEGEAGARLAAEASHLARQHRSRAEPGRPGRLRARLRHGRQSRPRRIRVAGGRRDRPVARRIPGGPRQGRGRRLGPGHEVRAYGQYFGDGVARENYEDRIVIYRDTLERDFGHDKDLLARQVERTLRHELAHHLGWNERGVGGLGL